MNIKNTYMYDRENEKRNKELVKKKKHNHRKRCSKWKMYVKIEFDVMPNMQLFISK